MTWAPEACAGDEEDMMDLRSCWVLACLGQLMACSQPSSTETKEDGSSVVSTTNAIVAQRNIQVGVRCQQDYQNNWQVDVGNNDVWSRCSNFYNNVRQTEVGAFYYNLHGAKPALESPDSCGWACGYADSVDFLYMNTHGGGSDSQTASRWTMWDVNQLAYTSSMRLGASSRENMVLATFSCQTHALDGFTWNRWLHVFAGGMVMTVGGRDMLFSGQTQSGSEFADRLDNGEPIGNAWNESTWYADNSNHPAAIATGRNPTDCSSRMGTTFDTLFQTPILRDGAIGYMCWNYWN